MSFMKSISPILAGVTLIGSSFLLGAFYTHWIVDHETIWTTQVLESSITNSLRHYATIFSAPAWYHATLISVSVVSLLSVFIKLVTSGTSGMLFDGASVMLLASAIAVYSTNVHAALAYLPLDKVPALPSFLKPIDVPAREALQSLAASHMIIAVSLTGVLALQAAQGYSDKPNELAEAVKKEKEREEVAKLKEKATTKKVGGKRR